MTVSHKGKHASNATERITLEGNGHHPPLTFDPRTLSAFNREQSLETLAEILEQTSMQVARHMRKMHRDHEDTIEQKTKTLTARLEKAEADLAACQRSSKDGGALIGLLKEQARAWLQDEKSATATMRTIVDALGME